MPSKIFLLQVLAALVFCGACLSTSPARAGEPRDTGGEKERIVLEGFGECWIVQRYRRKGAFEAALKASEDILRRNPRNRWARLERATVFTAMKDYDKAAEELDVLIEMFPDFQQARNARERLPVPPRAVKPAPSPSPSDKNDGTLTALLVVVAGVLAAALAALIFRRRRA